VGNLDYKGFSKRHRPHIHPPDSIIFVTYRLAGSIPKAVVRTYKAKKDWLAQVEEFNRAWFVKFEDVLHKAQTGPMWMKNEHVVDSVASSLQKLDSDAYRLDAYSVMSNHVHAVFKPFLSERELREGFDESGHLIFISKHPGLSRIMQSLKGGSSRECNRILSRAGQFWEHESFDHVIREGKFYATIRYVLNNPVKAGLVRHWREWRWNYCRRELADRV